MSATLQAPAVFSPAGGGADSFTAVKQLVLDAVSSPLTRAMYARALEDFFAWWEEQDRPAFTRATVQAWRAALEAKGLAPASIHQNSRPYASWRPRRATTGCSIRRRAGDPGSPRPYLHLNIKHG